MDVVVVRLPAWWVYLLALRGFRPAGTRKGPRCLDGHAGTCGTHTKATRTKKTDRLWILYANDREDHKRSAARERTRSRAWLWGPRLPQRMENVWAAGPNAHQFNRRGLHMLGKPRPAALDCLPQAGVAQW